MFWWRACGDLNGDVGKIIQVSVVAALPCQVSTAGRTNSSPTSSSVSRKLDV